MAYCDLFKPMYQIKVLGLNLVRKTLNHNPIKLGINIKHNEKKIIDI